MSRRSSTGSEAAQVQGASGVRVLHFDCFSGIAGNMCLGALLDLGLPLEQLEADLSGLGLPHRLVVQSVKRKAIAARHVDVEVPGHHHHGRDHLEDHDHSRPHRHEHGRHYAEIAGVIRAASLDPAVRERALAIFDAIAHAEAKVHGIDVEHVHFHEVGAVDAIVDVTGVAIGLSRLGVARVTASPVAIGTGRVETAHGTLPLPAPATLELLRGMPVVPAHVEWETVTPTGAAILRCVVDEFRPLPAMTILGIGHGAGEDRPGPLPNVLRAVLGQQSSAGSDRVVCLETNLDDLVPEHFDHLMERLFEAGALDVSIQHVQMKKNRPGFLLRVLARPSERLPVARTLFAESTAIGVRVHEADRVVLAREERKLDTPWGRVGVKLVWDADGRPSVSAEYDDCKRVARERGVPIREVVQAVEQQARAELERGGR